jgi:hypothetical protein
VGERDSKTSRSFYTCALWSWKWKGSLRLWPDGDGDGDGDVLGFVECGLTMLCSAVVRLCGDMCG